jgi:hypothetical protein
MSLWRRAPREVYRVYGEDQYLEGETAPEGEAVLREDATTVEPDNRGVASWATFAADVSPASPGIAGSSSARPSGLHAGRLIGVGLLVGVGLATLVLVFLNLSHRRGTAPELVGQGARVETGQRVAHAAGAGSALAIVRGAGRSAPTPRFSASSGMVPERRSRSKLSDEASPADDSDAAPRVQRLWLEAPRPSGNAAASVAVQAPAPVALEPPVREPVEPPALGGVERSTPVTAELSGQDEFGFEQ